MTHWSWLFAGALASAALLHTPAAHSASESILYSFCQQFNCTDGALPSSGLIDYRGVLYGPTLRGGLSGEGTVFSLKLSTGAMTTVHSFDGTHGAYPSGTLLAMNGKLYGTTSSGGSYDYGTVFALNPKNGIETVLHSFNGTDGSHPAGLIKANHLLYGTTTAGGGSSCDRNAGCGTVFSLDPATGILTTLHAFAKDGADGNHPPVNGTMIYLNGTLYGVTSEGGRKGSGIVFSVDPDTGTERILHSFEHNGDGVIPNGVIHISGKLYGTTEGGGTDHFGALFSLTLASGGERVLHSFDNDGVDGIEPEANVIKVPGSSLLYGVTYMGGADDCGAVFSFDRKTAVETILYSFKGGPGDGFYPTAPLLEVNGTLYGTTGFGGTGNGEGTVFSITP